MSLEPGRSVGSYRVVAPLGAGGMGEVWRATDVIVGRDVAIKVLSSVFLSDVERLVRFEREARLLGQLNHPNIAHLYGVEEHDGERFIVMECVEGEDLATRLKRGRIPLDESLDIARQIARALEEAHQKGIVHRDLKPANVKITPDGLVKVLDFGLAKAWDKAAPSSPDLSRSPTLTEAGTAAGAILGTAAYMSPEQARGRTVDKQTDIWAFGVVLFEMLTGRRLFEGDTLSDVLASVLRSDPEWSAVPKETPIAIRRLLARCLARNPKERLHDVADARLEIEAAISSAGQSETGAMPQTPPRRRRAVLVLWPASLLLAAAGGTLAAWGLRPDTAAPVRRFEIPVPDLQTAAGSAAISLDGKRLLYLAGSTLWVRDFDRLEPRAIVTNSSLFSPFWSPDGAQVAYFSRGRLWRAPAGGGEPTTIASTKLATDTASTLVLRTAFSPGGSWLDDARIVFAPGQALFTVSANGGDLSAFHQPEKGEEAGFRSPSALPGSAGILVVVDRRSKGPDTIAVLSGGRHRVLLQIDNEVLDAPVYSSSGHVLYWRRSGNAGVWAFPFSIRSLERTGEPVLIEADAGLPSVSRDGTLLLSRSGRGERYQLTWVNRDGSGAGVLGDPSGTFDLGNPTLSPDGRRIVVMSDENGEGIGPAATTATGGPFTRLTYRSTGAASLAWLPDGRHVAFDVCSASSDLEECIVACAADGSGGEKLIASGSQPEVTRDGKRLVFVRRNEGTLRDLYSLPLGADGFPLPNIPPQPLIVAPYNQSRPRVSPDGGLVAYCSNEGGQWNVYLSRFPTGEGRWRVSTAGGMWHVWSHDGSRLYWEYEGSLWEAKVRSTPSVSVGEPRMLFSGEAAAGLSRGFSVSPDDERFLVVKPIKGKDSRPPALIVIENWFREHAKKARD